MTSNRRPARSVPSWYAQAGIGHSIGLGYLILTLRELARLSQSRQVPTVNTLLKVASACGLHLVVGLADPEVDSGDLCLHNLSLLGILKPAPDGLVDFS